MRKIGAAVALLGAVGVGSLVAAPANAATTAPTVATAAPTVATAAPTARVKAVCARVDAASQRVDKAVGIIEGGADTKGSLLYLQARIAKATSAGHPADATRLKERLTVRNDRLTLLKDRQTLLATDKQDCAKALGS